MKLHLSFDPTKNNFTSLGEGYVAVNGQQYKKSLVVTPDAIFTDWSVANFTELSAENFEYLYDLKPEIILLGTGAKQYFAHPERYRKIIDAKISIEFMSTPAACHTYNILMNESRNVLAAVLL